MLRVIDKNDPLPDAKTAVKKGQHAGLVAVGLDMGPQRLLEAYRKGIFPWSDNPVTWWSPDPRAVLEPANFHASKSLRKFIRRRPFEIRVNTAFEEVMRHCAAPAPGREETWISDEFIHSYAELHAQGKAHSVECWTTERLVGGVYGVSFGGYFCGESMFHTETNASKYALWALCEIMLSMEMRLLDIQMITPITESLGGIEISREVFLNRLDVEVNRPINFSDASKFPLIPGQTRLV